MNKSAMRKYLFWAAVAFAIGLVFPRAYSAVDQTYQQLKILVDVLDLVRTNYVEETDSKKLIYGAAKGVVAELDDFSQFMEPDNYKKVKSDTEGEFGGLGIRISMVDQILTVVTPLPGTPAYRAGVMPGDKIIKIEGEETQKMSADDAVSKMRGAPGTKVKITIAREPEKKNSTSTWTTQDLTLERAKIVPEVVQYRMIDGKIGYLRLIEFSGHATEEFIKALNDLKKQGMEALVVDLRYNPGGLLTAAVDLSRLFLSDNKMIVFTKGRKPENYQEFRANSKGPFDYLPLVVLTNGGSASGSEIFAGAMQDNKRAVIIGSKTFGKASVQSIIPLADGSGLRLTVAKYYTPSGRSIQRNPKDNTGGIIPDIVMDMSRDTERKVMLQNEKLYSLGKEPSSSVKKEDEVKDEVLERGVDILKAREAFYNLRPQ